MNLPENIGGVNLTWDNTIYFPRRDEKKEKVILVPQKDLSNLHIINKGEHMIASYETKPRHIFFIGIDENPFVTEITKKAYEKFLRYGEIAFYSYLAPEIIQDMKRKFRQKALRQGDMWAVKIPLANPEEWLISEYFCKDLKRSGKDVCSRSIYGTNHAISGSFSMFSKADFRGVNFTAGSLKELEIEKIKFTNKQIRKLNRFATHTQFYLAKGILTAPDHKPLVMDGKYVVLRSRGLQTHVNRTGLD